MSLRTLMTSEFNDGYTPSELKKLLFEFRDEYRKLDSHNTQLKRKTESLNDDINVLKSDINKIKNINSKLEFKIKNLREKKLSFKERVTGKIRI